MRPSPVDSDAASSSNRLSRIVGAVTAGWTPTQSLTEPTARIAASPSALVWLLVAGLAVVLATGYVISRHGGGAPAPAAHPTGPSYAATTPPAARVVVDVGGRVRHPGLVTLPLGARVADAIAAAGGALHQRDLLSINLAGRVADGQFLMVGPGPGPGAGAAAGAATGSSAAGLVSLNSATVDQLDALPGVGPVLAQRIVTWREQHGGFAGVEQLQQVPGIGARKYADLKALVSP